MLLHVGYIYMMLYIKKHSFVLLIVLLFLVVIYSITYGKYNSLVNKHNNSGNLIRKSSSGNIELSVDKALNYVNEYKLDYLDILKITFDDVKTLTNQDKLKLAYYYNKSQYDLTSGISSSKYNEYLTNLFGKISVSNEDVIDNKITLLKYNSDSDTYRFLSSSNKDESLSTYISVISFNYSGKLYTLKVNKFYVKDSNVYSSYEDYLNNKNVLFSIPNDEEIVNYIKNRIIIDYDTFSDKLYTYIYNFSTTKTSIFLKSYNIVK